jgi:NADH dehydrogenase
MQSTPTKIVLLGGGYVTVWAYRSLVKSLAAQIRRGEVTITVICPNEHHYYHGWTAESLTGIIQEKNRMSLLSEILSKATLIVGIAESWDENEQLVFVSKKDGSNFSVEYDHLLIGTGSLDKETIKGLLPYGFQVKDPDAFNRARQTILDIVTRAAAGDGDQARNLLRFTIAGGGLTGVELAANIAEWVKVAQKRYRSLDGIKPEIYLINKGSTILDSMEQDLKKLVRYAEKTLKNHGIEVISNTQLAEVTLTGSMLSSGVFLKSSVVISTVGQYRSVLVGTENLPRDEVGRLHTNVYQQVGGLSNVWGGGDACNVTHYDSGQPCTSNALWAIKHGHYVGLNIGRAINGKKLRPFTYKGLGQTASLGLGKGITELYGLQFTGALGWIMRWLFFQYFMPSKRTMFRNIGDWLSLLILRKRRGM